MTFKTLPEYLAYLDIGNHGSSELRVVGEYLNGGVLEDYTEAEREAAALSLLKELRESIENVVAYINRLERARGD